MVLQDLFEVKHVPTGPRLCRLERNFELIRRHNRAQELFRIQKTVLRTRNEDETLNLKEVRELCGVDLPHADSVGLLVRALDDVAEV